MTKLSLNKAAKEAGVAKSTLLERLNHNDPELKMSAEKNAKGHWEIDPSELFRVFPRPSSTELVELRPTTHENDSGTSALAAEVKMLRELMGKMEEMNERERGTLEDQVANLRGQIERQSADHRQALAAITDQREKPEMVQKSFFGIKYYQPAKAG